jgi:hypothetical protein
VTKVDNALTRVRVDQAEAQPIRFGVNHPTGFAQTRTVDDFGNIDGGGDGLEGREFTPELEINGEACGTGGKVELPLYRAAVLTVEKKADRNGKQEDRQDDRCNESEGPPWGEDRDQSPKRVSGYNK